MIRPIRSQVKPKPKPFLCEGALRHKYKEALFEQLESGLTSVEDETEQKTRQQNKTQGSKQGKQIIDQNICVLIPLVLVGFGRFQ